MHRLCVFCGSSSGHHPAYGLAEQLARELARRDLGLVYGGGRVGLMGVLADAALAAGAPGGVGTLDIDRLYERYRAGGVALDRQLESMP